MKEKVVYILGAGFSAALGVPLMSNFISRSRDIYAEDNIKYSRFSNVYEYFDEQAKIRKYFNADLFNSTM